MNDDLNRKWRAFDSRQKHTAEQEFADVRLWYHQLPVDKRRKLKQDLKSVAGIADRWSMEGLDLKLAWSWEQYDEEGNVTFSIGTTGKSATDWLQAIDLWDETESFSTGLEE